MRLDTILCPGLRSMGDMLFIKQVLYEPPCLNRHPYIAVLAQELIIYKYSRHQWREQLAVNHVLSEYLDSNPLPNSSQDCDEKFNTYLRHIVRADWMRGVSQDKSYVIFVNALGFIFSLTLPDTEASSLDFVHGDILMLYSPFHDKPANTSDVTSICWVNLSQAASSSAGLAGALCVGRSDGSCTALLLSQDLSSHTSLQLLADAGPDYQQVDHLKCIEVRPYFYEFD